ncbi:WAT1-related protein At5g40230-like [Prunus dulcis]|uniref:WAT1-related protein At5g40230-like n=1 Tax=Prunus dulcis TaxID=3755 RepID=UPI0014837483|nr:WAT1-related protein At5g40230-like [Prunus dulcis]
MRYNLQHVGDYWDYVPYQQVYMVPALQRKGPVCVSMFKPLAAVVKDVIDVIFLGQALYLGSLIGAGVIISGFYAVIWGKAREEKLHEDSEEGQSCLESSTDCKIRHRIAFYNCTTSIGENERNDKRGEDGKEE